MRSTKGGLGFSFYYMKEETQHGEMMKAIGIIEGKIDGINQRLDISNGRTAKLETKVESLEKSRDMQSGAKMNWREIAAGTVAVLSLSSGILIALYK